MELKKILSVVGDARYKKHSILKTFAIAFDEHDELSLFRKRAALVEYLQEMFETLHKNKKYEMDESDRAVVNEICLGFCYLRLSDEMGMVEQFFSKGNRVAVLSMQKLYKGSEHYSNITLLKELASELRTAVDEEPETDESQKEVLLEIVSALESSVERYPLYGDRVMQRLFYLLSGIVVLQKDTLVKIKSKRVQDILRKIYTKVSMMNKIADTLLAVGRKLHGVLELFS